MSISIITLNAQFITRLFLIWRKDLLQSASWNAIPGYYWNHHLRWTEDSTNNLKRIIFFSQNISTFQDCRARPRIAGYRGKLTTPWLFSVARAGAGDCLKHSTLVKTRPSILGSDLKSAWSSLEVCLKASWVLSRQPNRHRFWLLELLSKSKHS